MTHKEAEILGIADEAEARSLRDAMFEMTKEQGRLAGLLAGMEEARELARQDDKQWKADMAAKMDKVPGQIAKAIATCREERERKTKAAVTAADDLKVIGVVVAKVAGVLTLVSGAVYGFIKAAEAIAPHI